MAIKTIQLPDGSRVEINEWLHWPLYSVGEGQGAINAAADPQNLGNGAAIDMRLFSYVPGGQIPQAGIVPGGPRNATRSDTNQVARSRINHDEAALAFSMTYEMFSIDDAADEGEAGNGTLIPGPPGNVQGARPAFTGTNLRRMQRDVMLDLLVGAGIKKPQARAPLAYYGQGIGAPAWGSGDALTTPIGAVTTTNLNYGTGGPVSPHNQRRWNLPIYIHSDRVMYARLHSPVGQIVGLNQSWRMRIWIDGLKRRPVA